MTADEAAAPEDRRHDDDHARSNTTITTTTDTDPLAGARELIAGGVPVFVAPPSGDPAKGVGGFWLPKAWENTRPDPKVLDRWKQGWAVCAVMGHGLDLLDVDPRAHGNESFTELVNDGLVPTVYASQDTPSGGFHLFVASLDVRSRDGVRPGIDVKAGTRRPGPDGKHGRGFAFIAPTLKVSKETGEVLPYVWDLAPDAERIAAEVARDDTGTELARLVVETHSGVTTAPRGDALVGPAQFGGPWGDIGTALSLGRHRGVLALASALRRRGGFQVDDALEYMRVIVWPLIDQSQGGHPYTRQEFDATVRDVFARYPDGAVEGGDEPPVGLLDRIRDGAWLDAQQFPPLQWAVPGLVSEGFGLLVGPPNIGKSSFALALGLAVASGTTVFGRLEVEQRPVLYAALEDGNRRMQDRARALLLGRPIPPGFQYFTSATPDEILPILKLWLAGHPGGLVMLDTLGKVMPDARSGESAYQRDYRVGGAIKTLTDDRPGSTALVVHHNRKAASSDWMDDTSGTNGLNGAADFTLRLARERNSEAAVVKVTGRDVPEGEYAMRAAGGTWTLDGASLADAAKRAEETRAAGGLGEDQKAVLEFVHQHPGGVSPGKVAAHMGWTDTKTSTYLGRLLDADRVARPRRGIYTPVGSVGSVESTGDGKSTHPTLPTGVDPEPRAAE